eukprot:m.265073 g.265073  ORF g.265073 m.265073 type:complete len:92 (+) comp16030_c0_seq5:2899-3174(+)
MSMSQTMVRLVEPGSIFRVDRAQAESTQTSASAQCVLECYEHVRFANHFKHLHQFCQSNLFAFSDDTPEHTIRVHGEETFQYYLSDIPTKS